MWLTSVLTTSLKLKKKICSKAVKESNDNIQNEQTYNLHNFKLKCQSSVISGKFLENVAESHENLQSYSSFVVAGNLNESEISQIQLPLKCNSMFTMKTQTHYAFLNAAVSKHKSCKKNLE